MILVFFIFNFNSLGNQRTSEHDKGGRHLKEHSNCSNNKKQGEGVGVEEAENASNFLNS